MQIVLASSSPYRQKLIHNLRLNAISYSPNIDETPLANESPKALVERLAIAKTMAVPHHLQGIIIGSDQVASLEGVILGKPLTIERAIEQLTACSGKRVDFFTGLCVYNHHTNTKHSCVEVYSVVFRTLSQAEILRYVELDQPLDCAGSFKSEGLGISLFEKLIGDDPNTLIGLPMIKLCEFLRQEGVAVP